MGVRNQHKHAALKAQIIVAAREIILKHGLQALSVRIIAKNVGCSVGTIYNVFENIDDIILHINGQSLDLLYEFLALGLSKSRTKNKILFLALRYFAFSKEYYNLWNALFDYRYPNSVSPPTWYQKKIDDLIHLVGETLIQQQSIPIEQAHSMTTILWAGIHGICTLYHGGKLILTGTQSVEVLLENYVKLYISGVEHVN